MSFVESAFFIFIALFLPAYFLSRGYARLWLCLAASYLFYAWWDWRFLGLIVLSTVVDYACGALMERGQNRRIWLLASICSNLGILATFKYLGFFAESLSDLLLSAGMTPSWPTLNIILPVGISFYTFQSMSYTIDVYRRQISFEPSFIRFAAYVALFPQLVAGPIVRAAHLLPQLQTDAQWSGHRVYRGLELMIWGYFLKVCLADNLAIIVDPRFADPTMYGGGQLAIATAGFAFQIYGDFAGYSLIAIGLGRVMGLHFPRNFNRPYLAVDFSDFWQRWHISLSSWIRDYLYIPLGGNRSGPTQTSRNLVITMGLGGLWHGANWTFVVWGFLHGLYLLAQHALVPFIPGWCRSKWTHPIKVLLVFVLVCFSWIFFRAGSLVEALTIIDRIMTFAPNQIAADRAHFLEAKCALFVAIVLAFDLSTRRRFVLRLIVRDNFFRVALSAALVWSIFLLGNFDNQTFIYFQF